MIPMGDRTNIADARQHDAEQAASVIERAMRNEGLIDKDVRLMGEIITEALDAAGFDVVLRADPDTSDELAAEARRLLDAYPEDVFESPPQDWKAGMVTGTVPDAVDEDGYLDVWITPDAFAAHVLRKIALPVIAALLAERDADVSAGAVARTVAMSHIAAERDAERAARERAETEVRQLRALTEGDPYSIYYEAAEMRSELMHLRRWKLEATEVIESWELVYEALGDVGGLGQRRSDAVLAEVLRMKAELDRAQLRSIEASNPGIDMDEVRRVRLAYPDHERHETVSRAKYGASLDDDADAAADRGVTDGDRNEGDEG